MLSEASLRAAVDALAARDPDIARCLRHTGYPLPRLRAPGFATLLQIITAQQLSTRSAAALWRKLEAVAGGAVTAERYLALGEAELRACGFSANKAAYGRGLAEAVLAGTLPVEALAAMEAETAVAALTGLRGFGRWSAEIYLMFALNHPDIFPADDLALQVGYQRLRGLDARPKARPLRLLVEPWRPWRSAGALFLWRLYGSATLDAGAPPSSA